MSQNRELREDGGFELRDDGGIELREGEADHDDEIIRFAPLQRRVRRHDGRIAGVRLAIAACLRVGGMQGSALLPGAAITDHAARFGRMTGVALRQQLIVAGIGALRGQIAFDPAVIDADLLAIGSL